jgi:hypothetical protein
VTSIRPKLSHNHLRDATRAGCEGLCHLEASLIFVIFHLLRCYSPRHCDERGKYSGCISTGGIESLWLISSATFWGFDFVSDHNAFFLMPFKLFDLCVIVPRVFVFDVAASNNFGICQILEKKGVQNSGLFVNTIKSERNMAGADWHVSRLSQRINMKV